MSNSQHAERIIAKQIEALAQQNHPTQEIAAQVVQSLTFADLITPESLVEEWTAVVAWKNSAGQTEQQTGAGPTRDAALRSARQRQEWLLDPTEVGYKIARRKVPDWEVTEFTRHD